MKKYIFGWSLLLVLSLGAGAQKASRKQVWADIERQVTQMLAEARADRMKANVFPRTLVRDTLKLVNSNDWTSGFFPGMLWMLYEHTGKRVWLDAAREFTGLMIREPFNGNSHDVGFKVYDSYGNGLRLTKDTSYRRLVIEAAKTLSTRFNPSVGCIKSWDNAQWKYPVIIDNMMNLELLFEATRLSGDSSFYRIAVSHANTTKKNHFRPDYSSYHVVDYDPATGGVIGRTTHQGYAPESAWARGQAWGLYGYTMCYRETGDTAYLGQANRIAHFILGNPNLPADLVPYWDYDAPNLSAQPRDASAAAIMAAAFYELSKYSKGFSRKYKQTADRIMQSLANHYRAPIGTAHGFILLHSTGHKPANSEIDVPLIYADYYYLEALLRSGKN